MEKPDRLTSDLVTSIANRLQSESDVISSASDEMELRNHPVMLCDGVRMWPPKWLQAYGSNTSSVSGEVALLRPFSYLRFLFIKFIF